MNANTPLSQISPLDGRYAKAMRPLAEVFSESGLIRARLQVEVSWLLALNRFQVLPDLVRFSKPTEATLMSWIDGFTLNQAQEVKDREAETNHDVKALEYWMQEQCRQSGDESLIRAIPAIHFACTSEDINNLAVNVQTSTGLLMHLLPAFDQTINQLITMAHAQANMPLLARTHGQNATPVTLGKEMAVFVDRFTRLYRKIAGIKLTGKMNGATGGFNAHMVACPTAPWQEISNETIKGLGFEPNSYTTQIEPHDRLAELFALLTLMNTIAIDLARDCWQYIALDYYKLKVVGKEVGSSTMPHKVNPIDFENAEGNLGLANALLTHMAQKLPISRLQRDLSDSTVQRNIGSAFGYTLLAWQSLSKGLGKLSPNPDKMVVDLMDGWEVLTEAVQTVLRAEGREDAYDLLKNVSRGIRLNAESYQKMIHDLPLSEASRARLKTLTPVSYIGMNAKLALSVKT